MEKDWIYRKSLEINATVDKVWAALTQSEYTRQYMFGCSVISSWKVGQAIEWKAEMEGKEMVIVKGTILEIDAPHRISFSMFDPNMGLADIPKNYINLTYTLQAKGNGTALSLVQGDYSKVDNREKRFEDTQKGWEQVLPVLKKVAEQ